MDKIVKGMSEAGQHPRQCCSKNDRHEGLLSRMARSLKGAAAKAGQVLSGHHAIRAGSSRG